jgi:histidinol-phosphate phosphatase family protein
VWAALTAELAWARIAPGPRTPEEMAKMLLTSIAMPPVAAAYWAAGQLRARLDDGRRAPVPDRHVLPPLAILFDRDGTLIEDVPYNDDPDLVKPLPGALDALEQVRRAGVKTAVVSNQSAVGRGMIEWERMELVNARIEELLGPLGPWLICPHAPEAGCDCRKPAPGLVLQAARTLGVPPSLCALIGDIGADVQAAEVAGARAVLVPTAQTRPEEISAAPEVAATLGQAVARLLGRDAAREPAGERSEDLAAA